MNRCDSPCLRCTKVPDPDACDNKSCALWRNWFLRSWESLRSDVRASQEQANLQPIGVPLGGRRYPSPHRVREYLAADPCHTCLCPKDLCFTPCPLRRAWEDANGGEKT